MHNTNRKQRNSITGTTLSVNSTMNGDSGNVSQDEHDDDQEHYFDKIERLKRTENEVNTSLLLYIHFNTDSFFFLIESSCTISSSNKKKEFIPKMGTNGSQ